MNFSRAGPPKAALARVCNKGADFSIYLTIILDVAKRNKQNSSLALHIFFFFANLPTNQPSRYKQSVKGR